MDLFETALTDEAELRALYEEPPPSAIVARKTIGRLDEHCRRCRGLCRIALVASADAEAEQAMIDSVPSRLA